MKVTRYRAAGGVVVDGERVLVLHRPARDEVRLPKGHIDSGETPEDAALREVVEEAGIAEPSIVTDLGEQQVRFPSKSAGLTVERSERYFLMARADGPEGTPEPEFEPRWVSWDEAAATLTYEAEREWLRRAREAASRAAR